MSKRLNCFSDFSSKEPFLVHSDTSLKLELQNLLLKSFGGISEVGADGGSQTLVHNTKPFHRKPNLANWCQSETPPCPRPGQFSASTHAGEKSHDQCSGTHLDKIYPFSLYFASWCYQDIFYPFLEFSSLFLVL